MLQCLGVLVLIPIILFILSWIAMTTLGIMEKIINKLNGKEE